MKFGYKLLIFVTSLQVAMAADATITDNRYALPSNKSYIDPCQKEALLLHHGSIEKQQTLHRHNDFWVQYEIQMLDGSEWFVSCDLATGKIIREQHN